MRSIGSTGGGGRRSDGLQSDRQTYSRLYLPALVVGWLVMAVGLRGLFVNRGAVNPVRWAALFFGSALVHDLVVAPLAIAVALVVSRFVPSRIRPFLQAGLIVSAVVALFAFPLVRGYGRRTGAPTILPLDYGRGLLIVLAVVWATVIALFLLRVMRAKRPAS